MVMRRWVLAVAACGLIGAGCGDDGGDDTPMAGMGPTAGKGGSSGAKLTPMDVIGGACDMQKELMMCTGVDAFANCLYDTCGVRACTAGACKAYEMCVTGAANPSQQHLHAHGGMREVHRRRTGLPRRHVPQRAGLLAVRPVETTLISE